MTIESKIIETLQGDEQKDSLELIMWLKEYKLNPLQSSKTTWKISAKACVVCYFRFDFNKKKITIQPIISEYGCNSLSEEMKDIALRNKVHGRYCGDKCHGCHCSYKLRTIFGKKSNDVCGQSIIFKNPNAEENECIKELIKMRKNVIQNGILMPVLPRNFCLVNKSND